MSHTKIANKAWSLAIAASIAACILWSMWPALAEMAHVWSIDPTYSHGYLVPAFSLWLLWSRRTEITSVASASSSWGLVLIGFGAAIQLAGAYLYVRWLSGIALLPYLAGLALLVGGWPLLRVAGPSIAFLAFMVPMPYRISVLMRGPMQKASVAASAFLLQTLGVPALREGVILDLDGARIGVVEACSGFKMLIAFFALATGVAMVVRRPPIEKALIVLSSIPIAIVSNVARITSTGIMHVTVGEHIAGLVFHDFAGWFMMPLAMGLLFFVLHCLSKLFIEPAETTRPRVRVVTRVPLA